jgi:hypothetical protein
MQILSFLSCACLIAICSSGCGSNQGRNAANNSGNSSDSPGLSIPSNLIPADRKLVKKEAVATYTEKVADPLNDWNFEVSLYETRKTFHYLVKLKFEEMRGEDTLIFPDFGTEPVPALKKGKDKFSCLIGFIDKKDSFREYKLVTVREGREMKITTLHHYAVDTYIQDH